MTEKFRDGLGRELRYMEYKLRKRRSDRDKKKKGSGLSGSGSSINDPSASISEEFKHAMPSNHGEEDLQLQVALAVSREEANQQEKAEVSDKVRLEMALKESAAVAAKVVAQHSPARSPTSTSNQPAVASNQSTDPWGAPLFPPTNQDPFDPFSGQTTTNGFGSDAWGTPATTSKGESLRSGFPQDSWSNQNATTFLPASDQSNPWGPSVQQQAQADPWGSTPAQPAMAASLNDPWNTPVTSTAMTNQISGGVSFDPFKNQDDASFTPTENFDPLHEFDQLTIEPKQQTVSSTMYSGGTDLFSADLLTPQPVSPPTGNSSVIANQPPSGSNNNAAAGAFLGANAGLVNIDSLVTRPQVTHPYISINTTTTGQIGSSRNPFNQKGPSLSLNQMKSSSPNPFASATAPAPTAPAPEMGTFPSSMHPNPMYSTMMAPPQPRMGITPAMPPTYQAPNMMTSNPFGTPQTTQTNSFPAQQNQSLF